MNNIIIDVNLVGASSHAEPSKDAEPSGDAETPSHAEPATSHAESVTIQQTPSTQAGPSKKRKILSLTSAARLSEKKILFRYNNR